MTFPHIPGGGSQGMQTAGTLIYAENNNICLKNITFR